MPARALLPPVVRKQAGRYTLRAAEHPAAFRAVAVEAAEDSRSRAWREAIRRISAFSQRRREWSRHLGPERGDIHGHVLRTLYAVERLAGEDQADRLLGSLVGRHLRALERVVECLERDVGGARRIQRLSLLASDPHRGGQYAARVTSRGGACEVLKMRPLDGEERLFGTGPDSVASWVNRRLEAEGASVRLPAVGARCGSGPSGAHYGYMDWVDSDPLLKPFRYRGIALRAIELSSSEAKQLWADAGLLAAFAFGIGLGDLHATNLVVSRGADGRMRYHPVDCEFVRLRTPDLENTFLVRPGIRQGGPGHFHAGFEAECLLCGHEEHRFGFALRGGRYELRELDRVVPETLPSLVRDAAGRTGYRHFLGPFLSGLLTGWDFLIRHRAALSSHLHRLLDDARLRYLALATSVYATELHCRLLGRKNENAPSFTRPEREQLDQWDIPYFVRQGVGPIQYYDPYPERLRPARGLPQKPDSICWPLSSRRIDIGSLAVLLQDAIDHVVPAASPIDLTHDGIRVQRRPQSPRTDFTGVAGSRKWRVRIDGAAGVADTQVESRR